MNELGIALTLFTNAKEILKFNSVVPYRSFQQKNILFMFKSSGSDFFIPYSRSMI